MSITHNKSATRNTHPHLVTCDKPNCYWRTAHSMYKLAEQVETTHPCPYDPLKRKYMTGVMDERGQEYTKPTMGKSLIEKAWDELDAHFDKLMDGPGEPGQNDIEKGWCQALAWTIHTWTSHWFPAVEDVTREAVKRRKIRLGEIDWEPTPGYKYNPMPVSHKEYARINAQSAGKGEPSPAQKVMPKPKPQPKLTADQVDTIKQAMAMFKDADEVARILGMDVNVVKSCV